MYHTTFPFTISWGVKEHNEILLFIIFHNSQQISKHKTFEMIIKFCDNKEMAHTAKINISMRKTKQPNSKKKSYNVQNTYLIT